jgi:hypothetical protein
VTAERLQIATALSGSFAGNSRTRGLGRGTGAVMGNLHADYLSCNDSTMSARPKESDSELPLKTLEAVNPVSVVNLSTNSLTLSSRNSSTTSAPKTGKIIPAKPQQ